MRTHLKRLVVCCSGSGSNLQALIDSEIGFNIVGVIVDRPCFAQERAKQANIDVVCVDRSVYENPDDFHTRIKAAVDAFVPDGIILAGYLSILRTEMTQAYHMRIINIHPSILPLFGGKGFYGSRVHQAVLDAGCKITGATVHFVETGVDQGPIIAQRCIPVYAADTVDDIAQRIHPVEHQLLIESVQLFCQSRLTVHGRMVFIEDEK